MKLAIQLLLTSLWVPIQAAQCNIAIDIGHSVNRPGAISSRGIPEYQFNRRVALYTYYKLQEAGIDAFFVNNDEVEMSLRKRTEIAQEYKATHFISFHHDSVKELYLSKWVYNGKSRNFCDIYSGYSIFVSKKNKYFSESLELASLIGDAYRALGMTPSYHHNEDIPGERKKLLNRFSGVYRYDNLIVLKSAQMPSVLIECGIILNRKDEPILWSEPYLERIATGVISGLMQKCKGK
ncbi:MAG TPA: N-acetylmuramoyl-L-alanine amidase [bacterium (Candidatus Stahlbacteria)]|nr:N-acetylmuramoyl-L-alanine amidase [Candidatus Stahlbacteria bacterium]